MWVCGCVGVEGGGEREDGKGEGGWEGRGRVGRERKRGREREGGWGGWEGREGRAGFKIRHNTVLEDIAGFMSQQLT